jgi:hypothetical protein
MINKNGMSYMEFLVGVTTFNIQNSALVDRCLYMFILRFFLPNKQQNNLIKEFMVKEGEKGLVKTSQVDVSPIMAWREGK